MLVRLPKLACLLLPADFAGIAHFLLDFESCRAFICSRSPEMIFSTLVLLFCFTWSIRLKTAAAAGHGSARTDQNYGTLDQVSYMFTFHSFTSLLTLCIRITDACLTLLPSWASLFPHPGEGEAPTGRARVI